MSTRPILIAGPTASGKSALALRVAEAVNGVVINADSQQVFDTWRVLTARPSETETARVAHRLYGHVGLETDYSVGHWLREVAPLLDGPRAVIVGGTGLYFRALTRGLAPIPEVPVEIRSEGEALLERLGLAAFAEAFARQDPQTAARIDLENPRRVVRAWEVLAASGTGLATWQARTPPPLVSLERANAIALAPPRDWLYARCEARFDAMLAAGALDEARAVAARALPASAPGLKALGAAELLAHLRGEITLEDAAAQAKMETRRYAKRQLTWQRNQMGDWPRLDPTDAEASAAAVADLSRP